MKLVFLRAAALLVVCVGSVGISIAADAPAADKGDGKFVPLFNGKDLDGWDGDPELWKVVDGVIRGSTDEKQIKSNSFLATKKPYKNFVLKTKFRLRNGNSGIQYRSKQSPNYVVGGYQADIADDKHMGILYEEKGRGILVNVKPEDVKPHVKAGDWNEYIITANGPQIKQELNGFTTVDYQEKDDVKGAKEGIIALQIHVGPKMQIEFKDVEIQELP